MKKRIIVTIAVVAVLGGCVVMRRLRTEREPRQVHEEVRFERTRIEHVVETTGIVEPQNRIEIKPPVGGRMDRVLVGEGEQVESGQVIGWMSSTDRATLLDAARAEGTDVLAKWEDAYKPTPIIAPLDGVIIARKTEPGQTVTTHDALFVLADRLIVNAQVDETDIRLIAQGVGVTVVLDAYPEARVTGAVHHIAYEAITVNNVTIYEVDIEMREFPPFMRSGMTATVRFSVAVAENALTLPRSALTEESHGTSVLVAADDPEGVPERRFVQTGLTEAGRVQITAGLDGTETVLQERFKIPQKRRGGSPFMPSRGK